MAELFSFKDDDGRKCYIAVGKGDAQPEEAEVPVVTSHLDPEEFARRFARREEAGVDLTYLLLKVHKTLAEKAYDAEPEVNATVYLFRVLGIPVEDELPRVAKAA